MAPKKAAKKAAKKTAGIHDPHKAAKDARRTFEHLGRVQALSAIASAESETLDRLTATADAAFRAQHYKAAADLLRAAEHLSFASLHHGATETVAGDLKMTIQHELQHLAERAEEHRSHSAVPPEIQKIAVRFQLESKTAWQRGAYRAALEYARGAEALAHVDDVDGNLLSAPRSQKRLQD